MHYLLVDRATNRGSCYGRTSYVFTDVYPLTRYALILYKRWFRKTLKLGRFHNVWLVDLQLSFA